MSAKIAAALHEVMSKVGYVQKTNRNDFHKYNYAGEADLLDKLRPAMLEAGLLLLPSGKSVTPIDEHGNVTVAVEYTLAHKDGDIWPDKLVAFGAGNDRAKSGVVGDKGVYKALTGANKYLLFKLFQIETGDDPERDEAPVERPARREPTTTLMKPREEAPNEAVQRLIDEARRAATGGTFELERFWNKLQISQKAVLQPHMPPIKAMAEKVAA